MKTRAAVALEMRQYLTIEEAGLEAPESGGLLAHIASADVRRDGQCAMPNVGTEGLNP